MGNCLPIIRREELDREREHYNQEINNLKKQIQDVELALGDCLKKIENMENVVNHI